MTGYSLPGSIQSQHTSQIDFKLIYHRLIYTVNNTVYSNHFTKCQTLPVHLIFIHVSLNSKTKNKALGVSDKLLCLPVVRKHRLGW